MSDFASFFSKNFCSSVTNGHLFEKWPKEIAPIPDGVATHFPLRGILFILFS
jgi:hypothetical protein